MNKITTLLSGGLLLCCSLNGLAQTTPSIGTQNFSDYYHDGMYFFDGMQKIRLPELFTLYKPAFGLGTDDDMVATNNVVAEDGAFTTKYELHHKGIPVEGAFYNVIGNQGIVQYVNGFIVTGLNVNNTNLISMQQAIQAAITHIGATQYLWDDQELEAALQQESGDPLATNYPKEATLLITKKRGEDYLPIASNYQLCYKVTVMAIDPSSVTDVYVNANDGSVFTEQSALEHDYTAVGTQWTWYNGWQNTIKTRSCGACFNFWLHDVDRNIYTTRQGYYPWSKGSYNKDNNNNWVENDTKTAATAHWGLERAWEYYLNRHGRWGTNYGGKRVHVQTAAAYLLGPNANAAYMDYNGNDNIYLSNDGAYPGAGSPGGAGYSMAALDVLGHEYNHGMIRASSNLGILGDKEAKALNEGYSDIFGNLIERYTLGTSDWSIGEALGWSTRYMDNPHNDLPNPSPARYMEPGYWDINNYHNAGGVIRKWFYLIAQGGTFGGYTVNPLGISTADDITYITYNWWLWSNLKYIEAANQTVHATVAHWGKCSEQHKQVARAFRAVGLNVPLPLCFGPIIDGPVVVAPSDHNIKWTLRIADLPAGSGGGTISWNYPQDWTVEISSEDELILQSSSSMNSQQLTATYLAPDGTTYTAEHIVHFSDVAWQPTNNMPPIPTNRQDIEDGPIAISVQTYPNPANQEVHIYITGWKEPCTVMLYDISGRLVHTTTVQSGYGHIDLGAYQDGIYLLKTTINGTPFTERLSIIH